MPCSSAMSRDSRSHRFTLAGPGTGDAMPGVFAHEQRRASPRRIERADLASTFDEALFVEHAVRRQKHLAVHVPHDRLAAAQRHVDSAVVQLVLPFLVEAQHDVEHSRRCHAGAIQLVQVAGERARGDRDLADAAFQEIAGQRGLRQAEQLRPGLQCVDLGKQIAKATEVESVVAFLGTELRDGELDTHTVKIG